VERPSSYFWSSLEETIPPDTFISHHSLGCLWEKVWGSVRGAKNAARLLQQMEFCYCTPRNGSQRNTYHWTVTTTPEYLVEGDCHCCYCSATWDWTHKKEKLDKITCSSIWPPAILP
jgi:hypothetical protein